jgi:hypothetical protein
MHRIRSSNRVRPSGPERNTWGDSMPMKRRIPVRRYAYCAIGGIVISSPPPEAMRRCNFYLRNDSWQG